MKLKAFWKNIRFVLFWSLLGAYLLVTLGLVSDEHRDLLCNRIEVLIADSLSRQFVSKRDILASVGNSKIPILGIPLKEVEAEALEEHIIQNPFIRVAEVYKTVDGKLAIHVRQRKPMLRVMKPNSRDYYLDEEGYIIPFSGVYPSHVLVANGSIPSPAGGDGKLFHISDAGQAWNDLYLLAGFIQKNELWKNQIEQVYIRQNGDYELVPRVGAHLVILGKPERIPEKFRMLEILYFNGLGKSDWNRYELINLKYDNQVICTKR